MERGSLPNIESAILSVAKVLERGLIQSLVSSIVDASETTTSTSYVGLTTPMAVNANIGQSGKALVIISCYSSNSNAGVSCYMSFAVSGATTIASADKRGTEHQTAGINYRDRRTVMTLVEGLTAGVNTFTAQFRTGANTATFRDRQLIVIPL